MELKASELRIGNHYISETGTGNKHEDTVVGVVYEKKSGMDMVYGKTVYGMPIKACKPIPITEEWLKRLGFKLVDRNEFKNINLKYFAHNSVLLFYNDSPPDTTYLSGYGFIVDGLYYAATFKWIEYVHQLQNLYFMLTREELTVKEGEPA